MCWGDRARIKELEAEVENLRRQLDAAKLDRLQARKSELAAWKQAVAPVEVQWANDVKKAGQDPAAVMSALFHGVGMVRWRQLRGLTCISST